MVSIPLSESFDKSERVTERGFDVIPTTQRAQNWDKLLLQEVGRGARCCDDRTKLQGLEDLLRFQSFDVGDFV